MRDISYKSAYRQSLAYKKSPTNIKQACTFNFKKNVDMFCVNENLMHCFDATIEKDL